MLYMVIVTAVLLILWLNEEKSWNKRKGES
jgi:hypothetical protein